MKSSHVIVAGAAAVIVAGVVFAFLREAPAEPSPDAVTEVAASLSADEGEPVTTDAASASTSQSVHVDELTANPNDYTGSVMIRGVVAGINQEEGVVALIDSREFEECGTVACATNYLPVRVDGTLPEPLSLVQVVGEVTRGADGLEVRADSVKDVK